MSNASRVEDKIKELKDLLISDVLPKVMESSKRKSVLINVKRGRFYFIDKMCAGR
jgi:hypothetical protein